MQASHCGRLTDGAIRTLPPATNGGTPHGASPSRKIHVVPSIRAHGSNIRLRAVFECQPDGVAIFDSRGAFIDVNPAGERILGLSRAQLFDLPIRDPCFRTPGPAGTAMAYCDHPIVIALETNREVRGCVLGIFNSALNETRWLTVDAIPHLCRREPALSEVFAFFSAIAAPQPDPSAIEPPLAISIHQRSGLEAIRQLSCLSGRERQVLDELAIGNSNKLIAFNLGISARTVEIHRAHVLTKLQVRHSALAIRIAVIAEFAERQS